MASNILSSRASKLVMGLDIGSTKICACICEIGPYGDIHVRGFGTSASSGLNKGKIVHAEDLQRSIEKAIQRAELAAGARVDQVLTNLPVLETAFMHNTGLIISKEESGKISEAEKIECLKRSKAISKATDQTVLHMIPLYFKVDDAMVQNPVGVSGTHLETQTHIILVDTDQLNQITFMLKRLRLKIAGIVYDGLAAAQTMLSDNELKNGAIVMDMGGRFTKVGIFKNGLLQRASVIPIGGDTITQDIAQCLKTSIGEAERIKILKGAVNFNQINPGEFVEIRTDKGEKTSIQRRLLAQIIHARVTEWMTLIQQEMSFDFDPHYSIALAGRGSQLTGLDRYVEQTLNRKVRLMSDTLRDLGDSPEHASAIGVVVYGLKSRAIAVSAPPPPSQDPFNRFNSWIREFF